MRSGQFISQPTEIMTTTDLISVVLMLVLLELTEFNLTNIRFRLQSPLELHRLSKVKIDQFGLLLDRNIIVSIMVVLLVLEGMLLDPKQ